MCLIYIFDIAEITKAKKQQNTLSHSTRKLWIFEFSIEAELNWANERMTKEGGGKIDFSWIIKSCWSSCEILAQNPLEFNFIALHFIWLIVASMLNKGEINWLKSAVVFMKNILSIHLSSSASAAASEPLRFWNNEPLLTAEKKKFPSSALEWKIKNIKFLSLRHALLTARWLTVARVSLHCNV